MAIEHIHKVIYEPNDEFYTQYNDIANELKHYLSQFQGKHILCPCDWNENIYRWKKMKDKGNPKKYDEWIKGGGIKYSDALRCNFVRYLEAQAPVFNFTVHFTGFYPKQTKKIEGLTKFQDSIPEYHKKYGDDLIVITNPPFSLHKEFLNILLKNKIKFIFVVQQMQLMYKETFKHLRTNKIWTGYTHLTDLVLSDGSHTKNTKKAELPCTCKWLTNLKVNLNDNDKILRLTKTYKGNEKKYIKYRDYDCLYVSSVKEIPKDYGGMMGVPLSFIFKYNPDKFELLGTTAYSADKEHITKKKINWCTTQDGKRRFAQWIIRNKKPQTKEVDW